MQVKKRKYFNTDGIRGRVGEKPITPDFIMKLGWAIGKVLQEKASGPILIGKDTRVSGYMFESALEAGLSAAGVDIRLLGPVPTPAVAYLTRNTHAQAGIVISASHNPHFDNGIKIFSVNGRKLPDSIEMQIEEKLTEPFEVVDSSKLGKARRIMDAPRRYIEFCKSRIDFDLSGIHIIVDCANGAAYKVAPKVFEELGATVETIGAEPDGFNINHGYGATMPQNLQKTVKKRKADIGIAFDGDGDRLIMVDHKGNLVDGDETIYIMAKEQKESLNGGVVGTQMSNMGLELALKKMGLEFHRAKVGDRYVMELLDEKELILGGEPSGHIVNRNFFDAGDGIISALQVLWAMKRTGDSLHGLKSGMKKYPQRLSNIKLQEPWNMNGREYPELDKVVKSIEAQLGEKGRVLLRPSGTEPLLRIMVEGRNVSQVELLLQTLTERVENTLFK